jgi:hypothetical protein
LGAEAGLGDQMSCPYVLFRAVNVFLVVVAGLAGSRSRADEVVENSVYG